MAWIVSNLWLVPALPLAAGGLIALAKQGQRKLAPALAIGSMLLAFILAVVAFLEVLSRGQGEAARQVANINWFQFGDVWLKIGWLLDPLTAVMLLMVTFVGLLIFIYSVGYMHDDENFTRFFCFLALFAGAMLTVVIANSLLLLFMGWEIMGLTSYLLIGFWFHKPSAAAAAKKAFIVTRIGDLGFFLAMAWLYAQTGTLLLYDGGAGCMEHSALTALVTHTTIFGWTLSTAIALLFFCGAAGKSGQVPLHVWLPDAMEGPTPVSALIHAATMVAAGVFLMARIYPLLSAQALPTLTPTLALQVVTWVGAITALFGALSAIGQFDIKGVLAYSTVSQLGYMMMGIGVGGVSIGMFHLITHAFFKALLFLGAGSVIHGCSGEQDIRHMGGLHKSMRLTFLVYTAGMLALCGFPLFAGFWSKDEILHAAFAYNLTHLPFYMGAFGALLTAFYMTRQLYYVFAGETNRPATHQDFKHEEPAAIEHGHHHPHESPSVMTTPLVILSVFAVLLGFIGTPLWPWFQSFLEGEHAIASSAPFMEALPLMLISSAIVLLGLGLGWALYGRKPITSAFAPDILEAAQPQIFHTLTRAFYFNQLYDATIVRFTAFAATLSDWFDRWIFSGIVKLVSYTVLTVSVIDNFIDTYMVNAGFDAGCRTVSFGGKTLSRLQGGRAQSYLRMIGLALIVLMIFLLWGGARMITLLTALPAVGAILLLLVGNKNKNAVRWIALAFALAALVITLLMWRHFDPNSGGLQFQERYAWVPALNIEYRVGVDGLGLLMLLLSAIVVPIGMAASHQIEDRISLYFALMLLLQSCLFGAFTALNFVHWFTYWELSLVPAFFLIKLWGGPRRTAAATQFLVYTMVGSVAMLLSFLAIYLSTGKFDFIDLAQLAHSGQLMPEVLAKLNLHCITPHHAALLIFAGVFLGFAVKVPLIPFHTWLPAAYSEAPTGTTILLTGAMSKMGVYGFLRILLPLFSVQMQEQATKLLWLAVATIVLSTFAALAQKDLKRIFAYSSINHLGYCLLAIFAVTTCHNGDPTLIPQKYAALSGVFLQMFNHGLTAATIFWCISMLEARSGGLRGLNDFGGIRKVVPVFTGLMGIALFSSLGLPGLNGFIGEFLIFKGSFPLSMWATSISVIGLLVTALVILNVIQKVFAGPLNPKWATLPDLTSAERLDLVPVLALMAILGLCPQLILGVVNNTVIQMVQQLKF